MILCTVFQSSCRPLEHTYLECSQRGNFPTSNDKSGYSKHELIPLKKEKKTMSEQRRLTVPANSRTVKKQIGKTFSPEDILLCIQIEDAKRPWTLYFVPGSSADITLPKVHSITRCNDAGINVSCHAFFVVPDEPHNLKSDNS